MKTDYFYYRSTNDIPEFHAFIKSIGGNPNDILRKVYGKHIENQEKLNFVPWESLVDLYEGTSKDLNEPFFGIKWAQNLPQDFRNGGPFVLYFSIAKNLTHFLDLASEFQSIHNNVVKYEHWIDESQDLVMCRMRYHPMAQYSRQFTEHAFAVAMRFGERFIPNFKIQSIQFQHSPLGDSAFYEETFKCPLRFDCDDNLLAADAQSLKMDTKNLTAKITKPLVKTFVNWRIKKNIGRKPSVAMTLAELLPSLLGVRKSSIETSAAAMNMSPKKLQRLLQYEQTSYSQVLDDVRKNLANRLLVDSEIPLIRIAALLDYASDKSFIAAFKRWYDTTPAKYRRENR